MCKSMIKVLPLGIQYNMHMDGQGHAIGDTIQCANGWSMSYHYGYNTMCNIYSKSRYVQGPTIEDVIQCAKVINKYKKSITMIRRKDKFRKCKWYETMIRRKKKGTMIRTKAKFIGKKECQENKEKVMSFKSKWKIIRYVKKENVRINNENNSPTSKERLINYTRKRVT